MESITAVSNRKLIYKKRLKLYRYLRRNHKRKDRETVFNLLFNVFPDEGIKLIDNSSLFDYQKKALLLNWLIFEPQITCGIFADQRKGKDATICKIFEDVIDYFKENFPKNYKNYVPRFVTLGNVKKPPFVDDNDMYFSFRDLPFGTEKKEVWIYSSEIDSLLPSRGINEPENKLFTILAGTMAQNKQKLFGCCKLASRVDLNFLRDMNCKIFKFISKEKLRVEGIERRNILSELGNWLLPNDPKFHEPTLLAFDNQLLTVNYKLPSWWTEEYSEQFKGDSISMDKIWDYVDSVYSEDMKVNNIIIAVAQKFRKKLTKKEIENHLNLK